ncbi:MAG: AbiJ-NTD4 domain-containing protein [Saprospiraceae bacterium]
MSEELELGENGVPLSFSQRMGLAPKKKAVQLTDMDVELATQLWNRIGNLLTNPDLFKDASTDKEFSMYRSVWNYFLKKSYDEFPTYYNVAASAKNLWFNDLSWAKRYELIEFCLNWMKRQTPNSHRIYTDLINLKLKEEYAGYRIINGLITPITSEIEQKSVTETGQLKETTVSSHFLKAQVYLSNRTNPDHLNSIKESISAVEAALKIHLENPTGSLGAMLGKLPEGLDVPTPLVEGWKKLYGWTSGPNGIRHSLSKGEMKPDFAEAQYMLVTCSAFVNYLKLKFAK